LSTGTPTTPTARRSRGRHTCSTSLTTRRATGATPSMTPPLPPAPRQPCAGTPKTSSGSTLRGLEAPSEWVHFNHEDEEVPSMRTTALLLRVSGAGLRTEVPD